MSKAEGVRKPNESQKANALWKIKAARDRGEEFYDPERKDNILGRNKTGLERAWRITVKVDVWLETCCGIGLQWLWPRGLRHGARDVKQAVVGKCLGLFGSVGQRALTHGIHALERSREARAAW